MQTYLLSKLVAACPLKLSEWYTELGMAMPEDEYEQEGFKVVEDKGTEEESKRWVTKAYFAQHYSQFMPH